MLVPIKKSEVENMILRHVPSDGRKILKNTVMSRVEKDYQHDDTVSLEAINDTFDDMARRGVFHTAKNELRRLQCWRDPEEKPAAEPEPQEPRVSILQAVREVAPGIIEGESNRGQFRMKLDEALQKAIERDELIMLRDQWLDQDAKVKLAENAVKDAKEKLKKQQEGLAACERKLAKYGFESETTRADEEKGRKKRAKEPPPPNGELFAPSETNQA